MEISRHIPHRFQVLPATVAIAIILLSALIACTADDAPADRLKGERRKLDNDLSHAIEAVDDRLEELAREVAPNGIDRDTVGTDASDAAELETDRLRQIRSALAYRRHQIDSTPDPMWRDFRNDAEQLISDAHQAATDPVRE